MGDARTAGLDLGGTKILGAVVAADGTLVAEERVDTPSGAEEIVHAMFGLAGRLDAAAGPVEAFGVGAAGLVDGDGTIRYAPNLKAFVGFPLRAALAKALGRPVVVDNDANVAAWGEVVHGAASGCSDVLVITLGTGVGGGLVLGGRLYRGAHGFAAEVGHFQVVDHGPVCACGERGHWEALASGTALGRVGREHATAGAAPGVVARAGGDPERVTGGHVGEAALAGDVDALAIVKEFATDVALGLAGLANVLDPELVVVGGGLVRLGDALLDPMRAVFDRRIEAPDHRPRIPIVPATLGERAGAIGAAALAREVAGERAR